MTVQVESAVLTPKRPMRFSPLPDMVGRHTQKKCIAVGLICMLLLFVVNLNGNVGVYIMEKYQNAGTGELTENNTQPQAIHIAYGENPTRSIVIVWASKAFCRSKVAYGLDKDNLRYSVSPSYQRTILDNVYGMHFWYRAEIKGLTPDTKYFYSIHAGEHSRSQLIHFRTAPIKSPTFQPNFLVFGDLGLHSKGFDAIMDQGASLQYHAIFHLGDIAYNLQTLQGINGDSFLKATERAAAFVPYLTTVGDHENHEHFWSYRYRFSMPGVPWPMPEEKLWYSMDIGNIHLISYSTETQFWSSISNVNRQFLWLVDDLHRASKNRHITPWIIVMGHKPLYCSQTYPQDCNSKNSKLRESVEELFYTFGVDLVLQGHCHSYERSWPMYKGKILAKDYNNPKAPVYVTHGTTGNEYITDTIAEKSSWTAFLMSEIANESYGRLKVLNDTHLTWDTTLTSNQQIVDSFILKKEIHEPNADIESFIRRARANQTLEGLLLGQNLSVAKGDFSGWRAASVMMLAFALVVLLFLFRVTVVEVIEMGVHIATYFYKKMTGQVKERQRHVSNGRLKRQLHV